MDGKGKKSFKNEDLVEIPDQDEKFEEFLSDIDRKERFTDVSGECKHLILCLVRKLESNDERLFKFMEEHDNIRLKLSKEMIRFAREKVEIMKYLKKLKTTIDGGETPTPDETNSSKINERMHDIVKKLKNKETHGDLGAIEVNMIQAKLRDTRHQLMEAERKLEEKEKECQKLKLSHNLRSDYERNSGGNDTVAAQIPIPDELDSFLPPAPPPVPRDLQNRFPAPPPPPFFQVSAPPRNRSTTNVYVSQPPAPPPLPSLDSSDAPPRPPPLPGSDPGIPPLLPSYPPLGGVNSFDRGQYRNLPQLPQRIPKVRMKIFHWDKIGKPKGTIWIQKKLSEKTREIEINAKEIETLFKQRARIRKIHQEKEHIPSLRPETVSLISPKRNQTLLIFISRMKKDEDFVIHAKNMNEEVFTTRILQSILSCEAYPLPEEVRAYEEYSGDVNVLEEADVFLRSIITNLPRFRQRVSTWVFKKQTFHEMFARADRFLDAVGDSCRSLLVSENWHLFLQIVLAIGNFMNGKNKRKIAHGFRIRSLRKLSGIKSTSSSDEKQKEEGKYPISCLLEYIIGYVKENYPAVEGFLEDLEPLKQLFSTDNQNDYRNLEDTHKDILSLEAEVRRIEGELVIRKKMNLIGDGGEDQYVPVMVKFLKEECSGRMAELRSKYQEATEKMNNVRVMYAERNVRFSFFKEIVEFMCEYQSFCERRDKWRQKRKITHTTSQEEENEEASSGGGEKFE